MALYSLRLRVFIYNYAVSAGKIKDNTIKVVSSNQLIYGESTKNLKKHEQVEKRPFIAALSVITEI